MTKEEVALIYRGEEVGYDGYERKEIDPGQETITWNPASWPHTGPAEIDGFRIYDVYGNVKYEKTYSDTFRSRWLEKLLRKYIFGSEEELATINLSGTDRFHVHLDEIEKVP